MEQRARHCQTLTLTAGQVGAALVQFGRKTVLTAAEVGEVDLLERVPELLLGRVR